VTTPHPRARRTAGPRRSRDGAAVLVTVIALVTIGLLGAVAVLPLVENAVDRRRLDQTLEYLVRLTDVDKRGMQKFVETQLQPPSQLIHMSVPITGSETGACGGTYDSADDWEPLADRTWLAAGVPTPIGTIGNALVRVGEEVMLELTDVRLADAERLDVMVDAPAGGTTGRVRWVVTDAVQELVSLRWVTPFTC
jgi:hypothetical protein